MEALNSVLVLDDFSIRSSYIEHSTVNEDRSLREIQNEYPINIDFDVYHNSEYTSHLITISLVQNLEKKPGYVIDIEATAIFSFSKELETDEKKEFILNSGVSICITNLRSYIANVTSYHFYGKYDFPAIDVSDLLRKKIASFDEERTGTKKTKKIRQDKSRKKASE
ncbi:MAG: hypothetical protein LBV71_20155 [Prevotella sp.]|jgi:preprotein translocase subunit SecB|nr:hypothetical protein [Prevotella sp.]